jgi:Fic family protein
VPARIADLRLGLPDELTADAEDAAAVLARFDAEVQHRFGVTTAVLLRTESASSSQIEQISASARAIAEAELTGAGGGNAHVIAANTKAMVDAIVRADPLDAAAIEHIQEALLGTHAPTLVGWRTGPVWVGSARSTPIDADYVAPDHRRVADAIEDLIRFADRDDLPIIPQVAVAHAQFETIHPFADGNGRTGRVLVQVMLRAKGLTRHSTVPVSAGLLIEKDRYFAALDAYRAGDAAPIITLFIHASLRAVDHGRQLGDQVLVLLADWRQKITARSDHSVWKIIELLPEHPVIDAETVARHLGIDPTNAHRPLRRLVEAGILLGGSHYKSRRYLYRSPELLALLDDYAAGFGRRS